MKLPKLNKYDIVKIRWIDSSAPIGVWMSEGDVDTDGPLEIESVGYYLSASKVQVAICMGCHVDGIHGVFYIPIGCISGITRIGE